MRTDEELYRDYINGNVESFIEIVRIHRNKLIYFIRRYVKDPYISEDISQDVFTYILVNKDRFNFKYSFKTFLYMLAKNRSTDYIRKQRHTENIDDFREIPNDDSIEDIISAGVEQKQVVIAINLLKHDYQAVIYLIDFEEMSYSEAAKILQKNVPQVTNLIHRARKSLKHELEREGIGYEK